MDVCRIRGKTEAQRRACHKKRFGNTKIPKRRKRKNAKKT